MIEPTAGARVPYLLLLARPSQAARAEAVRSVREAGLPVVAQYGTSAIEALATPAEAGRLSELGMFAAVLKSSMKAEHLERLTDEQRRVVEQWNTRFSRGYRRGNDRAEGLRGRSWGDPDLAAPGPHTAIDPEDFLDFLAEVEQRTGKPLPREGSGRPPAGRMTDKDLEALERRLEKDYGDPTVAYHLARLAARLEPKHRHLVLELDPELLKLLWERFFLEEACWRMTGEISVGLVFVESSRRGGPAFGTTERNEICQEIIDGLNWLASEHPGHDLSWVYDFQFLRVDAADGDASGANCPNVSSLEAAWRDPAMGQVSYHGHTYTADWAGVGAYREDMRTANRSRHAIVIFVTPFANCWHAYASGGRVVLARHGDWGGWGRHTLDTITAHEVGHLFGTADEYGGSGTPCNSCGTLHGCDQLPNGNCASCSHPHQDCMMDQNSRRICPWSRGHIGWAHLFVELTTADELWAGTDDTVTLDIGDRTFDLDTPDHDDRERNNRDAYPLWVPDLACADVRRVLIRKSPDGFAGGWRLHHVKLWCRGTVVCDRDVDRWLEDDHRFWVGCSARSDLVNQLKVKVTTADVMWAGTDDDVTLTLAGRSWNLDNESHDDFERGNTDTFDLDPGSALHVSDLHSVRIHKSPDGFAGGWKLKGVEILANGTTVFNTQSINKWLEDDDRTWTASF
jgi:hypothetical protein